MYHVKPEQLPDCVKYRSYLFPLLIELLRLGEMEAGFFVCWNVAHLTAV
jgi:hypothetical protein